MSLSLTAPWHRLTCCLALAWTAAFLACCLNSTQGQESPDTNQLREDDQVLLEGLRRRQLFETAESYCYDQLNNRDLDPTTQATMTIELMRTQMARAILSDAKNRPMAWGAIAKTKTDFSRAFPDHPRKFLVEAQLALSHLAHAQLLRQELDAEMAQDDAGSAALEQIRTARSLLNALQREIAKAIPNQQGRSLTEHELDSEQLLNLNNNLQFQLASCNLIRARLYPATDRLNRIDALNTVRQRLVEVQRSTTEGQPLWWKTKLGQIECFRLLGDVNNARSLAKSLDTKEPPSSVSIALLEQKARLAVDLGDEVYARSVLDDFNETNQRTAELELAIVQLAVDRADRATTDARKKEWIEFAVQLAQSIEKTYGGYWRRRADLLLIAATGIGSGESGSSQPANSTPLQPAGATSENVQLDLLIRLADEAARKENLDDALKAYDRASQLAQSLDDFESALQIDYRIGKILEQKKQHRLAAERLTTSASRKNGLVFAPSAHLIGCWNFAKSLDNESDRQPFQTLLRDHLRQWPNDSSSNQIRIWLGRELQVEKSWRDAVETYLNVENESPLLGKAIEQSLICARRQLLTEQSAGRSTSSMAASLDLMLAQKADSFSQANPAADRLLLGRVELDLIFGSQQPKPEWGPQLDAIRQRSEGSLASAAQALQAVSICTANPAGAIESVAEISGDQHALELGERCLAAIAANPALNDVKPVHQVRLALIDAALANAEFQQSGQESRKTRWQLNRASVLAELDRHVEAVALLTELEKKFPRNAGVQMQLARALTAQLKDSDPQQPLNKWRRIAAKLKPHTANWYEARYEVAHLLLLSGNREGSHKLLKYIQANPPGWEQSALKPQFEKLLRESAGK